jgi:modulator of FtsH protease HflK
MGWNDDNNDGGNKKQGPWGGKRGGDDRTPPSGGHGNDDMPDIDAVLRQAQDRFRQTFGGGRPRSTGPDLGQKKGLGVLAVILLMLWLGTGLYRVLPEEDAVILTFGKWTSTRTESGLGYHLPWPVEIVQKVNVEFDRRIEVGFRDQSVSRATGDAKNDVPSESLMLTGDENIIDIDFVVLWRVADARNFLFQIRDPESTIKKVAESAMREVIGRTMIQKALTESRALIESGTKELMQKMLDDYQAGVTINSVQLQKVDPPSQVVDAFDDVQRSRSDRERLKNEAETYRNDIVPRARGDAQKLVQDAEAYSLAVISKAQGEADRFLSVYAAYTKAQDVTSKRMYIETMQQVLQNSKKVIMGEEGGAPVLPFLSLDQIKPAAK